MWRPLMWQRVGRVLWSQKHTTVYCRPPSLLLSPRYALARYLGTRRGAHRAQSPDARVSESDGATTSQRVASSSFSLILHNTFATIAAESACTS